MPSFAQQHAVGVVVAVRGEIVWADLFADTDLLARYWTKLVRSYAAESLTEGESHSAPTAADAQHFLNAPSGGTETSEGNVGVYRYRELRSGSTETFVLESLLPGTDYDVHISKLKLRNAEAHHQDAAPLRPANLPLIAGAIHRLLFIPQGAWLDGESSGLQATECRQARKAALAAGFSFLIAENKALAPSAGCPRSRPPRRRTWDPTQTKAASYAFCPIRAIG